MGLLDKNKIHTFQGIEIIDNLDVGGEAGFNNISASGNITASGNIHASGNISADGDILLNDVEASGVVSASGNIKTRGDIVLPSASGYGIKRDFDNPNFTWQDIIGLVLPDPAGANGPSLTSFRGDVRGYKYALNDKMDCVYHIPHDHVLGSDLYVHLHWAHNASTISGNMIVDIAATYASRKDSFPYNAYSAPVSLQIAASGVNITNYPQYCHVVSEIQLSNPGGTGGLLDSNAIEVDGIVKITFTYSGTLSTDPFIDTGDVHYLSTGVGTVSKDPDYYIIT